MSDTCWQTHTMACSKEASMRPYLMDLSHWELKTEILKQTRLALTVTRGEWTLRGRSSLMRSTQVPCLSTFISLIFCGLQRSFARVSVWVFKFLCACNECCAPLVALCFLIFWSDLKGTEVERGCLCVLLLLSTDNYVKVLKLGHSQCCNLPPALHTMLTHCPWITTTAHRTPLTLLTTATVSWIMKCVWTMPLGDY